jgi:hypothetical protein
MGGFPNRVRISPNEPIAGSSNTVFCPTIK